ncbi:MAG: DUF362 domain-containing protein [Spirochaetes bacterium]|nr:DUF362 domain-containing protein [Spirochaetota bacterium]
MHDKISTVAVVKCGSYDYNMVKNSVARGIELAVGIDNLIIKGQKVLLKPNLLVGDPPEKCVNTHPSVFRAAAEILISAGAVLSYGDSPAVGGTESASRKAGLFQAVQDLKIAEADFKTPVEVYFEKGVQNKKFTIAKGVLDTDIIISLPKLKTHAFEKFTGCVKNQFGCVPGVRKGEYHIKLPDAEDFARMLVDLNLLVNPALYIMDGIWAMEGNGPRGGIPRKMNVILVSRDPIALDATVCRMIGLDPGLVPTIRYGSEAGMGTFLEEEIKLAGDKIEDFICPEFDIDRSPLKPFRKSGFINFARNRLVPRPSIIEKKCVSCGLCISICPTAPKSVNWRGKENENPPVHDYKKCIRCYCCQEICPEGAIELKKPLIRKILSISKGLRMV